jgi:hypothetical protein
MNSVDVSPSSGFSQVYDSMNNSLAQANPLVLFALSLIIIFYFVVFSYLGYNISYPKQQESGGLRIIEIIMWGLIVFLILINGLQYFFKIDVQTAVNNLFQGRPEVDIKIQPEKRLLEETGKKSKNTLKKIEKEIENDLGLGNLGVGGGEVFNVADNEYTYQQAKALCKAYGSKIATYNQIEDAYKSGAEWCNYGWSANQMAFFPTQKTTWDKLQKIKGHKHDCGRPGINGGYIKNPNVRFGVNCFGTKPNITPKEQKLMNNATPYPLTPADKKINKLVRKYKKNLDGILVSPFNYNSWNRL